MPTRYLKPGVRDSEAIDALSPMAECLFYRLLVTVDDFGRYDGRPAMIKAHCFPIKAMTVEECSALLNELASAGLLVCYTVAGKPYIQMQKWDNAPRAKESKFPPPQDGCAHVYEDARTPSAVLPETETETGTETGNREPEAHDRAPAPRKRGAGVAQPEDVPAQVWEDFLKIRKAKRSPLTDTALEQIRTEAKKAGFTLEAALRTCCLRGWQGFKADWVAGSGGGSAPTGFVQTRNGPVHESWFQPTEPVNVIDMEVE